MIYTKKVIRISQFLVTFSLWSGALWAQTPDYAQSLREVTNKVREVRHSKTGQPPYTFRNDRDQTRSFNAVRRALPQLFEIDQRILRIESNIAKIIQTQGGNLQNRHINQISRLSDLHSQYMKVRSGFVSTVSSIPQLNGEVARHMRDMKNQFRRSDTPKKSDGRVFNYLNGNVTRLVKVEGDYGVRQMLERQRLDKSQGVDFLRQEIAKIHQLYVQRTGGRPSARPTKSTPRLPGQQVLEGTTSANP